VVRGSRGRRDHRDRARPAGIVGRRTVGSARLGAAARMRIPALQGPRRHELTGFLVGAPVSARARIRWNASAEPVLRFPTQVG
jgi:hypothetical protein